MRKLYCKECYKEQYQLVDGLCMSCYEKLQDDHLYNHLPKPNKLFWIGGISKMGVRRIIEVPKVIRSFISDGEYEIYLLKKGSEED